MAQQVQRTPSIPTALALALALGACEGEVAQAQPTVPAHDLIVGIDRTPSPWIKESQYDAWKPLVEAELLRRTDTRLAVFAIDDVTAGSAAILDVQLPRLDPGAGATELGAARQGLAKAREQVHAALTAAMSPERTARWSDIVSTFDRVASRTPSARTSLVLLTDGIQSTSELDFEKVKIDRRPETIARIAGSHGFSARTLNGAKIYIVLPSASSGAKAPLNDRNSLRWLWEGLTRAAGGELASWDTALRLPEDP